jgi:ubiquitin C-terminal hydrolase
LKDDALWKDLSVMDGQVLMLMGTVGPAAVMPPSTHESSSMEISSNKKDVYVPCGLANLGNTCYLNASLQCLRRIPELTSIVLNKPSSLRKNNEKEESHATTRNPEEAKKFENFILAYSVLLKQMSDSAYVAPLALLQVTLYATLRL